MSEKKCIVSVEMRTIIDTIYPIGAYFWSSEDKDPSNFLGGTWEQVKDKFILAAGDSYAAGSTGGEADHKLTTDEMPVHSHGLNNHTHGIPSLSGSAATAGWHNHWVGATDNDGVISVSGTQLQWDPSAFADGNTKGVGGIRAWANESGRETIRVHINGHSTDGNGNHTHSVSTNTSTTLGNSGNTTNIGSGAAHNNMPPYITAYCWHRTA
jgi:microcystin-dependent protein